MSQDYRPPQPQAVHVHVHAPPPSQAIPALVNALCWPGLGQLIQGRLLAALVIILLWIISCAAIAAFGLGLLMMPVVWIGAILDAATYNPNGQRESLSPLLIAGVVACGLVMAGCGGCGMMVFMAQPTPEQLAEMRRESEEANGAADPEREGVIHLPDDLPEEESGEAPAGGAVASRPAPGTDPLFDLLDPLPPGRTVPEPAVEPPLLPPLEPEPAPPAAAGNLREFVDSTGEFRVRAEFLRFENSTGVSMVFLRREDGTEISLPMNRLSAGDQQWVRDELRARRGR